MTDEAADGATWGELLPGGGGLDERLEAVARGVEENTRLLRELLRRLDLDPGEVGADGG